MATSQQDRIETATQVDAVMRASRVLVAVVARSVAEVEDVVTLPQLRVLVMIASHGPQNLGAVAQTLGVHPSNATRTCERLVVAGLLLRRDDPDDRRFLRLDLTAGGRRLVEGVMLRRRESIEAIMDQMPPSRRKTMAGALGAFAAAAGELDGTGEAYLLALGE